VSGKNFKSKVFVEFQFERTAIILLLKELAPNEVRAFAQKSIEMETKKLWSGVQSEYEEYLPFCSSHTELLSSSLTFNENSEGYMPSY
jgi:hypothetical protein